MPCDSKMVGRRASDNWDISCIYRGTFDLVVVNGLGPLPGIRCLKIWVPEHVSLTLPTVAVKLVINVHGPLVN